MNKSFPLRVRQAVNLFHLFWSREKKRTFHNVRTVEKMQEYSEGFNLIQFKFGELDVDKLISISVPLVFH
jgi:hypothetical protein